MAQQNYSKQANTSSQAVHRKICFQKLCSTALGGAGGSAEAPRAGLKSAGGWKFVPRSSSAERSLGPRAHWLCLVPETCRVNGASVDPEAERWLVKEGFLSRFLLTSQVARFLSMQPHRSRRHRLGLCVTSAVSPLCRAASRGHGFNKIRARASQAVLPMPPHVLLHLNLPQEKLC